MPKRNTLNGLPNNLTQSYCSSLRYAGKGHMADWILNAARTLKINIVTLDILKSTIDPKELERLQVMWHLTDLQNIINKELNKNGFEQDFIVDAKIKIELPDLNPNYIRLYCYPKIIDKTGRIYTKGPIIEIAHEKIFDPFENVSLLGLIWTRLNILIRRLGGTSIFIINYYQ